VNVLSLFSGIGGLELGLERAGMTTVGQVEIDPFCRRVLAKHWPDVPRHDDVRTAAEWWLSTERPTVDIICGGFPCQDISAAGKRAGIVHGERSSLWSFMADAVRRIRPRYVLVENVSAILVRDKHGFIPIEIVAGDLAALGYDLRWDCVPAASLGAPHRRDRWFGIALADADGAGLERPRTRVRPAESGQGPGDVADAKSLGRDARWTGDAEEEPRWRESDRGRVGENDLADAYRVPSFGSPIAWGQRHPWPAEPDVGRVVDGSASRLDGRRRRARIHALGNAVVPQVAEHIGRMIMQFDHEHEEEQ